MGVNARGVLGGGKWVKGCDALVRYVFSLRSMPHFHANGTKKIAIAIRKAMPIAIEPISVTVEFISKIYQQIPRLNKIIAPNIILPLLFPGPLNIQTTRIIKARAVITINGNPAAIIILYYT